MYGSLIALVVIGIIQGIWILILQRRLNKANDWIGKRQEQERLDELARKRRKLFDHQSNLSRRFTNGATRLMKQIDPTKILYLGGSESGIDSANLADEYWLTDQEHRIDIARFRFDLTNTATSLIEIFFSQRIPYLIKRAGYSGDENGIQILLNDLDEFLAWYMKNRKTERILSIL